jgi:gas vesicle protein
LIVGGVVGILALLAGCATQGRQAKEVRRTVTSMQNTRQELVRAQLQADDVLVAMDQLGSASSETLPQAYKTFTSQVSQTVRQADTARNRAGEMRQRWREYIAGWEKEIDQLATPELREGAAERRLAVRKNYDRLRDAARALDAAYEPFLTQLQDIQKALSLDLTPAGVQAAQPALEIARTSAAALKQRIADFIAELDQVLAVSPPQK